MNPLLAYLDTRPLIFVAGRQLILLLWLGARKIRGYRGPMLPDSYTHLTLPTICSV